MDSLNQVGGVACADGAIHANGRLAPAMQPTSCSSSVSAQDNDDISTVQEFDHSNTITPDNLVLTPFDQFLEEEWNMSDDGLDAQPTGF